jgi:trigger factor
MQVSIEDLSPVEKKLAVEIPWTTVRERLDAAYRELSRGVKMPGFRPGKVPRPVLEQRFGKQVATDLAKDLVQESFMAAARQHQLEVVAEPVIEDAIIRAGAPFRYQARVEVRGKVESVKLDGLTATRKTSLVTDKELDHALEHERQQHTEYKPIEGRDALAATDVVAISVKGMVGEFKVDRPEVVVDLGDHEHDPLPGLGLALIGLPVTAVDHALTLELPEDAEQKELSGKTATLKITVKEAREKLVPALDDEFAKDTGEADSLAERKDKLRERLLDGHKKQAEAEVRRDVLKALVAQNQIPVAPALVERAVDAQLERARMSFAMQGMDLERSQVDVRALRERLRDPGLEEVRGQLLLEAVAEAEKIEVGDAELDARIVDLAKQRDKAPGKLKAEMDRDGSLDSLRFRVRQEKALDHVLGRATISDAAPDAGK